MGAPMFTTKRDPSFGQPHTHVQTDYEPSPTDMAIMDLLSAQHLVSPDERAEALELASKWRIRILEVLLARNWIHPDTLYRTVAQYFGLGFVDVLKTPPQLGLMQEELAQDYARCLTIPWAKDGPTTIVATADPSPHTVLFIMANIADDFELVIASKTDILLMIQMTFRTQQSDDAVFLLARRDPEMSAMRVFTKEQMFFAYALVTGFALWLAVSFMSALIALNLAMAMFYLGNFIFKAILVFFGGLEGKVASRAIEVEARLLSDDELPVYTVLVPMFREPEVLPILANALRKLDYPLGKLDIKIVLEEGDHGTIDAARSLGLEGVFELVLVPPSHPQTKPKACNYALPYARGEYLVIFDAEDKPEPDQLRKVVAAFRRLPKNTACIQCRLNYYNAAENWITRMFTLDYSLWFDLMLPGLQRLNVPIPLGGTSNHFRLDVLRRLGAWDPFNVTEDADLGIRMTQKGYRVGVIDSTTFEEANCEAGNWVRQRSRWIKGYMQTFLVHSRRPVHLFRTIGLLGFISFIFFIGGTALSGLLNPLFWGIFAIWIVTQTAGFDPFFPPVLLSLSLFNLLAGNGLFIYLSMIAPFHRRWYWLVPSSLTVIGYWALTSVAAYKGLHQLLFNPFYWEKTQHGLSKHTATEVSNAKVRLPVASVSTAAEGVPA